MTDQAITQANGEAILTQHVANVAHALWSYLKREPTSNQWQAMCSVANGVGVDAIGPSLLIRYFNAGNNGSAAAEFIRWDHVYRDIQLIKVDSFTARREAERALFLSA
jgi:lysozyme